MLFRDKRWLIVVLIIVLLHVFGVSKVLAQTAKSGEGETQNQTITDDKIKSLQAEINRLKKEKQAQELTNEAKRLQRELDSLKETQNAEALMKRPLPKSAQGAPLMAPVKRVIVHAGTPVILQIENGFTTEDVKEGDTLPLRVQRPVVVDGVVVVRQGVSARAKVTVCKPAQGWGGAGEITISIKYVPAVDDSQLMLSGAAHREGETSHGAATAVAVGTGILCFPLAITGAAVTGEDGKFPAGYEIVAHVDGEHKVKIFNESEQLKIYEQQREQAVLIEQQFQKQVQENIKKRKESQQPSDSME